MLKVRFTIFFPKAVLAKAPVSENGVAIYLVPQTSPIWGSV